MELSPGAFALSRKDLEMFGLATRLSLAIQPAASAALKARFGSASR